MDPHAINDTVLVLDFGGQTSYLITKRIREAGVYCELLPCTTKAADVPFRPIGIILSGGPSSVYAKDAPHIDHAFFELGVPVLGICYGLQEITWHFKGKVCPAEHHEYGHADLETMQHAPSALFAGLPDAFVIWMSHGDQLETLPEGFTCIGATKTAPLAAIESKERRIFGVQFHPEVTHTPLGGKLFANFALHICQAKPTWEMASFIDVEIERIRKLVGPEDQVIGAVSGGVDSTVAACLLKQAVGDRFHAILVDNGLMRLNECEESKKQLQDHLGINLTIAQASDLFMERLKGVTDPEQKRKIIGNTFIHVFEAEANRIESAIEQQGKGKIKYLLQGTLYPDVIESISYKGPSATIKTHHNVGGLLKDMKLKLIEPLRECFKDEVRALGALMKIDEDLLWRHPFPGPGLGIRILGEVTPDQVRIARHADHIYITEIKKAGLYRDISQAYAGVLPIKTVGVMGDARTWQQAIALRAVCSKDFMTADCFAMPWEILRKICNRIINEVDGVNRVFYDASSKPPSTIELE